ncbi:hypothetical protein A1O1_03595 [Capronia coronata CBS 617.96]|uniref:chitinase n=1 Tax=Capronia coronata CBS 617.96 TaxID=1182541 RepID=W9YC91_9EURO|nr:uncharacterized protein A1O1_03595 [Capronia coronata CBS 617.96]EXJ90492.1 hypothetical protein A1O1_03595 [Capronia coronata CBS 617.96]
MVALFSLILCLLSALPARCDGSIGTIKDSSASLEDGREGALIHHEGQSPSSINRRASYHFDALASDLNIVYYGQSNITANVSLTQVCSDDSIDVVLLGFIKSFYNSTDDTKDISITMDFNTICFEASAAQVDAGQPDLLDCVSGGFADEIASCQKQGKKVLISAGSASGDLYIPSSKAASKVAKMLWNMFLGGTDSKVKPLRPFGNVVLDGFDLDNENATNAKYLPKMVSSLRKQLKKDKSKSYYISAAPICALPDPETPVAKLINDVDFWNVQFYNAQACQLGSGQGFLDALQAWSKLLLDGRKLKCTGSGDAQRCTVPKGKFQTINNDITYPRLLIGTRAFYSAPKAGYVDPQTYKSLLEQAKKLDLPNLAGAMFWDGTYQSRSAEDVDGKNMTFAQVVRNVL